MQALISLAGRLISWSVFIGDYRLRSDADWWRVRQVFLCDSHIER